MRHPGDPDDDKGNRAMDYANDNVEGKLAEMDLADLCDGLGIGAVEMLEVFDECYNQRSLYVFYLRIVEESYRDGRSGDIMAVMELANSGRIPELFDEMVCAAIRANEDYQERMKVKLVEEYLRVDGNFDTRDNPKDEE